MERMVWMRDFATWLDINDKAKQLILLLQMLVALSAALYKIRPLGLTLVLFIVFCSILALFYLILVVFSHRYGLNALAYNKNRGILYDQTMTIENVALRRRTVQALLAAVDDPDGRNRTQLLRNTAEDIGRDFVRDIIEKRRMKNRKALHGEALYRLLLQYDSSSGMGRFTVISLASPPAALRYEAEIEIRNPFTECDTSGAISPFFEGYLVGVCSEVFDRPFQLSVLNGKRRVGDDTVVRVRLGES